MANTSDFIFPLKFDSSVRGIRQMEYNPQSFTLEMLQDLFRHLGEEDRIRRERRRQEYNERIGRDPVITAAIRAEHERVNRLMYAEEIEEEEDQIIKR